MSEHDHDHDVGHTDQDPALAGNVEIHLGDTALSAYGEVHDGLTVFSLEELIDDLDNLTSWSTDEVTFSFPVTESTDYIGNSREGTLAPFTQAQADAARDVFALYADVIALEFVDLGLNDDPDDDVNADIRYYNSSLSGTAGGASAGSGTAGDAWFYNYDPATVNDYNLVPGSYQYHLLVHELGHNLGMSHTSFVSGDTYAERANYLQNNGAYSVMSYLTAGSAGLSWDTTYSSTPMIADIAALQSIYGANMTTRTGDTVYGFNATADRDVFNFDLLLNTYGEIGALTIWDAGGIDTLDVSKFGANGFIDLGDGSHSSVGGYDLNVAIAVGAVIENAVAGTGDDIVLGNDQSNVITGGQGADTLVGGAGEDHLIGDNSLTEHRSFTHQTVSLSDAQSVDYTIDATGVTAMTIEMLISFDPETTETQWFADLPGDWTIVQDIGNSGLWLRSNSSWNYTGISSAMLADGTLHRLSVIYNGDAGEVLIYLDGVQVFDVDGADIPPLTLTAAEDVGFNHDGALADVRIFDGVRSDAEIAANAFATIDATEPNLISLVTFDEGSGSDQVTGESVFVSADVSHDQIEVVNFDDLLEGGEGDDILAGGRGADALHGGAGLDVADYRASSNAVTVDLNAGTGAGGDAQGDFYEDIEGIFGSASNDVLSAQSDDSMLSGYDGNDQIFGLSGQDMLSGGAGKDFLSGGRGGDIIRGGTGNDHLSGGEGADHFVFNTGDGTDRISSFDLAEDTLVFADAETAAEVSIGYHLLGSVISHGDVRVIMLDVAMDELVNANIEIGPLEFV